MDPRAEPLMQALQSSGGLLTEYVRPDQLANLIERHQSGTVDATDRLWRLLNLQIWGDVFLTGKRDRWTNIVSRPVSAPV